MFLGSTLHLQPQSVLNIPQKTNKINLDDDISNIVTVKKEIPNTVYQTIKRYLGTGTIKPDSEPETEEKTRKMTPLKDDEEESAFKIVQEMLDVSIFCESIPFTLLAIGNLTSMLGFYIPFIYLSQHVESSVLSKLFFISNFCF